MSQPGPSHRNDEEMREEDGRNELNQEKRRNEPNDEDEDDEWEEQTCIVEVKWRLLKNFTLNISSPLNRHWASIESDLDLFQLYFET